MRRHGRCLPILLAGGAVFLWTCNAQQQRSAPSGAFRASFTAGLRDPGGRFMGGTEMRVLAVHDGKLYADDATTLATPGFVIGQVDGDFPTAMNAIDQGLAVTLTRQCR